MLKIALVNPPQFTRYPQPPLGLALVAAVLEKAGHEVSLLDANAAQLSPEAILLLVSGSDVVGLTAMTPTISTALNIARLIKKAHPAVKIIMGGAHATMLPKETMESGPDIDVIIRGEGDETTVELLQTLEARKPLESVRGIAYRDGGIKFTEERPCLADMDTLPFPAYHLLPWKSYQPHPPHGLRKPFAAVVTSRGCPYHCAYCSKPVFGTKFRAQSPERVLTELEYIQKTLGAKEIAFYDDSFTLDKKRVHAITDKIIAARLKLAWSCETRVNLVDKELLKHMKEAGCYSVAYGIESASPEIIKVLHKDTTIPQVEEAVRATHEAGIDVVGYFMIGSPGETPETIRQTIDFARKLRVDFAQFSVTTPFPGTELYEIYMQNRKEPVSWDSFVYAGTDNPTMPVFESDKLSREDLKKWVAQAYRGFYLRPGYLWQRLRRCTSWDEIRMNFKGLGMLLKSV
ncbi:MAG TPA: radical SAM protein [Dehalococcoidales bacterium]|nr:radical SAM protein [Dehalococcoidales bacterium]